MPQITSITSEALQATIRRLLPSQQGFGEDLQASNVIMPVIDLTASAEGSQLPVSMQQAIAFGSQTPFDVTNTSSVLINTTGFYRVFGTVTARLVTGANINGRFDMSDGLSTKTIWKYTVADTSDNGCYSESYDFIVYLTSGDSLTAVSTATPVNLAGSTRQIADINGNLVNPSGFTSE